MVGGIDFLRMPDWGRPKPLRTPGRFTRGERHHAWGSRRTVPLDRPAGLRDRLEQGLPFIGLRVLRREGTADRAASSDPVAPLVCFGLDLVFRLELVHAPLDELPRALRLGRSHAV
jgi:hypothetical protein